MMRNGVGVAIAVAVLASAAMTARAEVNVGVTVSLTGPAASLGIPVQNIVKLFPAEVAGEKIRYTVLDDGSDPSSSARNFARLVEKERVDVIMGSSVTPATLSLVPLAAQHKTPLLSLAASQQIVQPQDDTRRWVFKAIQNESLMADATVDHMAARKIKTLAFIGFADPYGDSWLSVLQHEAKKRGIEIVSTERYVRNDPSVTAQVLRILSKKPDAVFIAGSGTPAALPQKTLIERGFKGVTYQTYGIANRDFLKLAGSDAQGAVFAVGPVVVASQLDDANPIKRVAVEATRQYEAAYGPGTMAVFAANAWDSNMLLTEALKAALKKEKPGTEAFRIALRDALESVRDLVTSQGVLAMSKSDHSGYDKRAVAMVEIADGNWKYLKAK